MNAYIVRPNLHRSSPWCCNNSSWTAEIATAETLRRTDFSEVFLGPVSRLSFEDYFNITWLKIINSLMIGKIDQVFAISTSLSFLRSLKSFLNTFPQLEMGSAETSRIVSLFSVL